MKEVSSYKDNGSGVVSGGQGKSPDLGRGLSWRWFYSSREKEMFSQSGQSTIWINVECFLG